MNGYKSIVAGICGAAVLLGLTATGAGWEIALASGFAAMQAAGAALRLTVPAR